jgi:hypothetical protein
MLKELSWYIETNRFSNLIDEIEEKAEAYRKARLDSLEETDQLREEFRYLCQWHMEKSGYRAGESSFIDVDAEFISGENLNRKALDVFEKEIIKAHMYQKHLWEFIGTTGSMTVITKTEMENNGQNYENYLPLEFKRNNEIKSPISNILSENPNSVPIYIYPDGAISTEYDRTKSRARFDTIKDKSGFDWSHKGWDPNYEIQKNDWHGEFDEAGTWTMVRKEEQNEDQKYAGAKFKQIPEIEILKDRDTGILYDPKYSLLAKFQRVYLLTNGDIYGAETTDTYGTIRLIKNAMNEMGITSIHAICGGKNKPTDISVAAIHKNNSIKNTDSKKNVQSDEKILELYGKLLGNTLEARASIKTEKEYAKIKKDLLKKQENVKTAKYGRKLAEKIETAKAGGVTGKDIVNAVMTGRIDVPISVFDEHDKTLTGLTDEEFSILQNYAVPDTKKQLFSTAVLNLLIERKTIASSGRSMQELFDIAYDDIVHEKKTNEILSIETSFSELCHNPEKMLVAETVEGGTVQQLLRAKENLPAQKSQELQERVNKAVDNVIRNFAAIRISTGFTPEEAVKLAAENVGGKDSDIFVPPSSGIVYKSQLLASGNSTGNRRIFSDIRISDFIEKVKLMPAPTKSVEIEKVIRLIKTEKKDISHISPSSFSLPNLLDPKERQKWYTTESFKETGMQEEEVEKLVVLEKERINEKRTSELPAILKFSRQKELDEKFGYSNRGSDSVPTETAIIARVVPATKSKNALETVTELNSLSSTELKKSSTETRIYKAATIDANGKIDRQIAEAVWADDISEKRSFALRQSAEKPSSVPSNRYSSKTTAENNGTQRNFTCSQPTENPLQKSEEELRLERMNANYEHDRAILAKSDPAFAKNQFWDVGHAEGSGEMSDRDMQKLCSILTDDRKIELLSGEL